MNEKGKQALFLFAFPIGLEKGKQLLLKWALSILAEEKAFAVEERGKLKNQSQGTLCYFHQFSEETFWAVVDSRH